MKAPFAVCMMAAFTVAAGERHYQVVARTEMGKLAGLAAPSVNDNGTVAFVGRVSGGESIYVAPKDKPAVSINPRTVEASRTFLSFQINNQNQVGARDRVTGPTTYVRRWNADPGLTDSFELVAAGGRSLNLCDAGTRVGKVCITDFDCPIVVPGGDLEFANCLPVSTLTFDAVANPTLNNHGQMAFVALRGSNALLVTPAEDDYHTSGIGTGAPGVPVLADTGDILIQAPNAPSGAILLFNYDLTESTVVVSTELGFGTLGRRPNISDNGNVIAFYGDLKDDGIEHTITRGLKKGPGLFAYLRNERRMFRLSGICGDKILAPGEFWNDNQSPDCRDGKFNEGIEDDLGPISNYYPDLPIAVNDLGSVAFLAANLDGKKALYSSTINHDANAFPVSDPYCVIAVGESITGLPGTVTDLAIADGLNNRNKPGDLVFWVKTTTGDEAIVMTRPGPRPLIFIPGIAGSTLENQDAELWPSIRPKYLAALSLARGKSDPSVHPADVLRSFLGIQFYGGLLDMLRERGGYRELVPDITCDSPGSCNYRIPSDAKRDSPNLFLFPYDWRISNGTNARRLRQYIDAIRDLYPEAQFDFITHSMGSLLARRYLLDHPTDHYVEHGAMIAGPFLGAPVSYYRLLKGDFFGFAPLDMFENGAITSILEDFPGFHELFPSPGYFRLHEFQPNAKSLLAEVGRDLNGDGKAYDEWSESMIRSYFNGAFPSSPVDTCEAFHVPSQDDWSGADLGVRFLHFVGVRQKEDTGVRLEAHEIACVLPFINRQLWRHQFYIAKHGPGDKTVPYLSAYREPEWWAPRTETTIVRGERKSSSAELSDDMTEHLKLTANPRVHRGLMYFLSTGKRLWTDVEPPAGFKPAGESEPIAVSRELLSVGVADVSVRDADGEESVYAPGRGWLHPDSVVYSGDQVAANMIYSPTGTFVFTFRITNSPAVLAVLELKRRDASGNVMNAVRFLDVAFPKGSTAHLVDNGSPPYQLEIDADADGKTDNVVAAQYNLSGAAAQDEVPPEIYARRICQNGRPNLQLAAVDEGSGVGDIVYQVGAEAPTNYVGAIDVRRVTNGEILAFGTDRAGNRTHLYRFPILPHLRAAFAGNHVRLSWEKCCWPIVVETSESVGPAATWRATDAQIQDFGPEDGVDLPPRDSTGFFRLQMDPQ